MSHEKQFYINGQWVEPKGDRTVDVINPATEEVVATIALGNEEDVNIAVAAARKAFESYSQTSREERIALLERVIEIFQRRSDEFAKAISLEMGAPAKLSKYAQAPSGTGHFAAALKALKEFEFEERIGNTLVVKEPIGVCGLITPWNWPINQLACKIAPALATGCTMVLKPSEVAPLSALLLAEVLDEAGVPAGVFNLVNGDGPTVGSAMSGHPDIDMMSFTGSTGAGRQVMKNGAETIKRVALELGGKSANILLDDVDFEKTITHGVMSCMNNSGQSCNAPTRMLVPNSRMDEAAAIAKAVAAKVKAGAPDGADTVIGPVVSKAQWSKIQDLIAKGIDEGAKLVVGGTGRPEGLDKGYYVQPTVFSHVTTEMTIAREEIFGPVLSMIPFKDVDEVIGHGNRTMYGLAAAVWTKDISKAHRLAAELKAGTVWINCYDIFDTAAPFGGFKMSGIGRELGSYALENYTEVKTVTVAL